MKTLLTFFTSLFVALTLFALPAFAVTLSSTDFESFTTGISVDGQGGWASAPKWDEDVVDYAGKKVWRVSNAVFSGSFGDMPFAPRPGGIVTNSVTNPVNSLPQYFAGESSTGADNTEFFGEFNFKSSTGTPQPGLRVTVSADNGQGGRQSFFAIEDNGSTGLNVTTFNVLRNGSFVGPFTIAEDLSYTDWHSVGVDLKFIDGSSNDVVRYFVNDSLVHTNTSWEQYYTNHQPTLHPLGVPVQTLLFRISSGASSGVTGKGFYIDNVETGIGLLSSSPESKDDCKEGGWESLGFKNQGSCVSSKSKGTLIGKVTGNIQMSSPSQQMDFNAFDYGSNSSQDKGTVEYWNYEYPGVLHYTANVICATVDTTTKESRFMFQIPDGWPGLTDMYVVSTVHDGGTPGTEGDTYGHNATGNLATAMNWCENGFTASTYPIVGGNLVVHK